MISWMISCAKPVCQINADTVPIDQVSGSHRLGRFLHDVITFSILGHCGRETCRRCSESEVCVESHVLSFSNPLDPSVVGLQ